MGKLLELVAKISLQGAQEARTGLKGVGDEAKKTGKDAKDAGDDIDKGLTGPFKRAQEAGKATIKVLGGVADAGHKVHGVFARVAGIASMGIGIGAALGGNAAVKAASDYADLRAEIEAVTGSKEAMERKLAFAQKVAGPSNFTAKQLGEAVGLLEAMNINSQRALPTMARLGMVFGADNEKLEMLEHGMGKLAQGQFFDADVAGAFGLNRQQFQAKGIEFSGTGELLSSAEKTFKALEQIVNEKYGSIFDKMKDVPSTKLASLQDSWERIERIVGGGIMTIMAPGMERLTQTINALGDSGVALDAVNRAVQGSEHLMGSIGLGGENGITKFVAGTLSILSGLPNAIAETGTYIKGVFDVVENNVSSIFNRIMAQSQMLGTTIFNGVLGYVEKTFNGIVSIVEGFASKRLGGIPVNLDGYKLNLDAYKVEVPESAAKYLANVTPLKDMPKAPKMGLLDKYQEYYDKLSASMKPIDNAVPEPSGNWLNKAMENAGDDDKLGQIAYNTKKSADLLSYRAQATGTGASSIIAPTAAELRGGGYGRNDGYYGRGRPYIDISTAESHLRKAIKEIIRQENNSGAGSGFTERAF